MKLPPLDASMPEIADSRPTGTATQTFSFAGNEPLYVTTVDRVALQRLAAAAGGRVFLECSIGDCIEFGSVVARMYDGYREVSVASVLHAFRLERTRSLQADLAYALRLLVDTAARALSPAVNDPATAVQALDEIEALLCRLASKRLPDGSSWEGFLHLGFDEIRLAAATQLIIFRRLRSVIFAVADAATTQGRRDAVLAYLHRIDAAIARAGFDDVDAGFAECADRQGLGVSSEIWSSNDNAP